MKTISLRPKLMGLISSAAMQRNRSIQSMRISGIITLMLCLFAFNGLSQATPFTLSTINLLENGCIEIPADHEGAVYDRYQFERIESHFADISLLKKHLGHICNNRITFMLNSDETAIIMHLHKDRVQPEQVNSVTSWNNYVQGKCIQL